MEGGTEGEKVDDCWCCGGEMILRKRPTIWVVACSHRCGAMWTQRPVESKKTKEKKWK